MSGAHAALCDISEKIVFSRLKDGAKFARIDLSTDWEEAPESSATAILNFKNTVRNRISTDPKFLIDRQRSFFKDFPKVVTKITQVLDDKMGRIEAAGCLETALLAAILTEYPSDKEVEFSVFLLKRGREIQSYQAYVLTWGLNQIPDSHDLMKLVDRDLKNGWQYYIHLQNHPFFFDNPTGDIGGTVACC